MEQTERLREVAGRLLERLEQAVEELDKGTVLLREKVKTENGEEITELIKAKRKGIVDRAGLKQLTGVLKDLQDILCRDGSMDVKERQLRLQKLEQEDREIALNALRQNGKSRSKVEKISFHHVNLGKVDSRKIG